MKRVWDFDNPGPEAETPGPEAETPVAPVPDWVLWACVAVLLVVFMGLWCTPLPPSSLPPEIGRVHVPPDRVHSVAVMCTAYTSRECETDSTPFITASNTRVAPGLVALSRDMLREYTPGAPFQFGDLVVIDGRAYRVEDTMAPRFTRRADIWHHDLRAAREYGAQQLVLTGPYGG